MTIGVGMGVGADEFVGLGGACVTRIIGGGKVFVAVRAISSGAQLVNINKATLICQMTSALFFLLTILCLIRKQNRQK
jgi:hypothetical protein